MPYYKVYNCFPSFTNTFTLGGSTRTNPVPNYGGVGDHLEDYFVNRMAETPSGGTDNLAAFLASQKSLTGIMAADLTGMANNLSVNYGITGTSVGYGLLDFRGDSWKHIIGDGLVAASDINDNTAYETTRTAAITILNHFKNIYPNISWAYAGLPHLPKYTTFAPTEDSSFSWDPSLTNSTGLKNNHWDASHPTGASFGETIFDWAHTPSDLMSFYRTNALDRAEAILDASDWACPDISPTMVNSHQFASLIHSIEADAALTRATVSVAKQYADTQIREFLVQPLVSSMLKSRTPHPFDDFRSSMTGFGYVPGVSGQAIQIHYGVSGSSAFACDTDIPTSILRAGMLEPAAHAGAVGFVYRDNIPLLIELACTGATPASAQAQEAVTRARNYIARKVYGSNDTTILPWSSLKMELKSHFSQSVIAPQLRTFSEAIPIGEYNWKSMYISGDTKNSDGVSTEVVNYESVYWPANAFESTSASLPVCPCPEPPTGACCQNNSCSDGVKEADCAGTWQGADTTCAGSSSPECSEPIVNCCIDGESCTPVPQSQCTLGTVVESCDTCCIGLPGGACICVSIATIDCNKDTDGDGAPDTVVQKICKKYDYLDNACCCRPEDTTRPGACNGGDSGGSIAEQLNCGCDDTISDCCPDNCATEVSVSERLQTCCNFPCIDNNNSTISLCNLTPCGPYGECQPISTILASPDYSDDVKNDILQDLTNIFGTSLLEPRIASMVGLTTFRKTQTVGNTLYIYKTMDFDPRLTYANFVENYTAKPSTITRIQSEFAFDRLLLPISYT